MHVQLAEAGPGLASWNFAEGDAIATGLSAVELLGGGNRSEAWLAWDDRLHTLVVAKLVRPNQVGDPVAIAGLQREARTLTALGHPSIVRSFSSVLDGARPHLVLESLDGPRLSTLLRRFGPLAPEQLVPLGIEVGSALAYMHGMGYVHLDVKPRNLIMGATPKLIDLGIARLSQDARRLTSPIGTDAYMAPEQCLGETMADVGPASDVWGLCVTLYEAIEGRLPFEASAASPNDRYPQLTRAPAPFSARTPQQIVSVIQSGLAKDPVARPSVVQLVEALEEMLPDARSAARRRLRRRFR